MNRREALQSMALASIPATTSISFIGVVGGQQDSPTYSERACAYVGSLNDRSYLNATKNCSYLYIDKATNDVYSSYKGQKGWTQIAFGKTPSIVWETEIDWNNNQSESGVVHQDVANTDHNDATKIKKGYDYSAFSEITPDPVAAFPMQEDSGTTIYDLSGNGHDGTYSVTGLDRTGLLGASAPDFDGTDDKATTDGYGEYGQNFTILAWVNPDTHNGTDCIIRAWRVTNVFIFRLESGVLNGYISDGSARNASGSTVPTDTWTFVALRYDGSTLELFQDASSDGTNNVSTTRNTNSETRYIGRTENGNKEFDGRIVEVREYDTALTDSQIQSLYDVVAADGSFTVAEKSFSQAAKPDLKQLDHSLNGVTDAQVDVVGSPNTADEEIVTQQLSGATEYNLLWNDSHTYFEIKGYCESEGDLTRTSTYKKLRLAV